MKWFFSSAELLALALAVACTPTQFMPPTGASPKDANEVDWSLQHDWHKDKGDAAFKIWCAVVQGKGLPRDPALADEFLEIAVKSGNSRAVREHSWQVVQRNEKSDPKARKSMETLRSLAKDGDLTAQFYVAQVLHKNGDIDSAKFQEIAGVAAANGSRVALEKLALNWRTSRLGLWALSELAWDRDPEARYIIGLAYETGDGLPRNLDKAHWRYRSAAVDGSRAGLDAFLRTYATSREWMGPDSYLHDLAEEGVPEALFLLGSKLLVGPELWEGAKRDGRDIIRRAALSGGSDRAIASIAEHFGTGSHESAERKIRLGECLEHGWIGETGPDLVAAARQYEEAAAMGAAEATYLHARLVLVHGEKLGIKANERSQRVLDGFAVAAKEFVPAQCALGLAHTKSWRATDLRHERSAATCVRWLRRAADAGYARAQLELGRCLESGYGVRADPDAALESYRKAAKPRLAVEQSAPDYLWPNSVRTDALVAYGRLILSRSEGAPALAYAGIRCLRMALAETDSPDAADALGEAYAKGTGVPRHAGIAAAWHREAKRLRELAQ